MTFTIKSIEDIENLRFRYLQFAPFDKVVIDKAKIKKQGVLRWAIKYAFWNVSSNGSIIIKDSSYDGYTEREIKKDFWQTKRELFKTLGGEVEPLKLSENEIEVKKLRSSSYSNTGVTFGVVFSGSKSEEPVLINCLESLRKTCEKSPNIPSEIIVCGPSEYSAHHLQEMFKDSINFHYLQYDAAVEHGRFLIGKKKNFLLQRSSYNVVTIMHARIEVEEDFVNKIFYRQFDMISPQVQGLEDGKLYDYLSYILIRSYNFDASASNPLSTDYFSEKYLYYMKNYYPYIDGGMIVFNKNVIKEEPFNNKLAWAEAEDVDVAQQCYGEGILIDFYKDIICCSQTVKYRLKPSTLKKINIFMINLKRFL
ncbi:hypothetical protein [Sulfurimonas diazotrophicus]|uniref:Glycosyltransferase family 2 protein n=1 Tax=Sulfurimonas diazotrophicus TaxID=3131939 RepID=A0ABZ3HAW6_9BACT